MFLSLSLLLFLVGAAAIIVGTVLWAYAIYLEHRGTRRLICPETRQPVTVEADAAYAARTGLAETARLRLKSCTRWPQRRDCDQACTAQVPFVGDSRRFTQYAPGGLPVRFLRPRG